MGMFYNGANCDIYIGKGAGKKLLADIQGAEKSIKIVSPYLSPLLIKELIECRRKDIEVQLITSDTIEDFYGSYDKNILKLINQHKETDQKAVVKREKWRVLSKRLNYLSLALFVLSTVSFLYFMEIKVLLALVPICAIMVMANTYRAKVKNQRIYSYWYSQLFPFKVYLSPEKSEKSDMFIHSKIYLIDDRIAYLGSLNFTASGTKFNYETRIRTEDNRAIREIKNEIEQLLNHSSLPERDIREWGRQLYDEPIN